MSKDTGGPAFPAKYFIVPHDLEQKHVHALGVPQGMTLRDYFAAKAMQGICAHHETWGFVVGEIVEQSYAIADEMLKAREA